MLSVQPGLRGSNQLSVGKKMATIQLFLQPREQVVVRRGEMRRIGRLALQTNKQTDKQTNKQTKLDYSSRLDVVEIARVA